MDAGEVVVMDVAGECRNYASDITRTVPANGKFTAASERSTMSCWALRRPRLQRSSLALP